MIPCRCNKRQCQARRNLRMHPLYYARTPKCHIPGCDGLMYVDTYRLNKGAKDRAPECTDPACSFANICADAHVRPHRVDNAKCDHYADYVTRRNTAPRSKHSPILDEDWIPF